MNITTTGFLSYIGYNGEFGNFNSYHHTFGKELLTVNVADPHDFELNFLHTRNEDLEALPIYVADPDKPRITEVLNWLLTNANKTVADTATLEASLNSNFGTDTLTIEIDNILEVSGLTLPRSITINSNNNSYKIWLSVTDFEDNYPFYDVVVVPPILGIDKLVNSREIVQQLLLDTPREYVFGRINEANREKPYTRISSLDLIWSDKDTGANLTLEFTFIVYGNIGSNDQLLKEELRKYIVENSHISDEVWRSVLAEIFISVSSYVLIPIWDQISYGNRDAPIYNPITAIENIKGLYTNDRIGFLEEDTKDIEMLPTLWQSLMIAVSPNTGNNKVRISSLLEDYMLVSSGPDYIRLSAVTRNFITKLNTALTYAADYDPLQTLPDGITATTVRDITYINFASIGTNCQVVIKDDFSKLTED